jgi:nucleoside-diphosphate-sugar epimerase
MRILIAGASGAIGRPLVRCLKVKQHEVFALALRTLGPDAVYYATKLRARQEPSERGLITDSLPKYAIATLTRQRRVCRMCR